MLWNWLNSNYLNNFTFVIRAVLKQYFHNFIDVS